jgi:hydrogenase maturation factor
VIFTERGEELVERYKELGIQATLLGRTTADSVRVILGGEEKRFLDRPAPDELLKIYDNN